MITKEDLPYSDLRHNSLLSLLKDNEINEALAFMLTNTKHTGLNVLPHTHSIEIYNEAITISVVFYVGYESAEYLELKSRNNLHVVSFNNRTPTLWEFAQINIKYIDNLALLFTVLNQTENEFGKQMDRLKNFTP